MRDRSSRRDGQHSQFHFSNWFAYAISRAQCAKKEVENAADKLRKSVRLRFARARPMSGFRRVKVFANQGQGDLAPENTQRARGYKGQSPDSPYRMGSTQKASPLNVSN
jgi:hypothetical protein